MNRLLYVARKAKGLTVPQLAKVLKLEESAYEELEHSLADVSIQQALQLSKLFDVEAELFIYTEGRDTRLLKYAMDEISKFKNNGLLDGLPPNYYFNIVSLGNTALTLQAELNHAIYRQNELEKDNETLRRLNAELKTVGESKA